MRDINLVQIAEKVIEEAAENTIRNLVGATSSYMDNEIRDVVKARAKELLKTPEMDEILKAALTKWIQNPVEPPRKY